MLPRVTLATLLGHWRDHPCFWIAEFLYYIRFKSYQACCDISPDIKREEWADTCSRYCSLNLEIYFDKYSLLPGSLLIKVALTFAVKLYPRENISTRWSCQLISYSMLWNPPTLMITHLMIWLLPVSIMTVFLQYLFYSFLFSDHAAIHLELNTSEPHRLMKTITYSKLKTSIYLAELSPGLNTKWIPRQVLV
jgi:hypothetical protein